MSEQFVYERSSNMHLALPMNNHSGKCCTVRCVRRIGVSYATRNSNRAATSGISAAIWADLHLEHSPRHELRFGGKVLVDPSSFERCIEGLQPSGQLRSQRVDACRADSSAARKMKLKLLQAGGQAGSDCDQPGVC